MKRYDQYDHYSEDENLIGSDFYIQRQMYRRPDKTGPIESKICPPEDHNTHANDEGSAQSGGDVKATQEDEKEMDKTKDDALEEGLREIIDKLSDGASDGEIPWEDVLSAGKKAGLKKEEIEEAINILLDKGVIYEPVLGRIKKVE